MYKSSQKLTVLLAVTFPLKYLYYKIKVSLFVIQNVSYRGPDSSVGIATGYRLDVPGIESRWGGDFSHTSRPALGPTQRPVQRVQGLSRG
jgi:hypothetical protein